jgi:hypothetical protein
MAIQRALSINMLQRFATAQEFWQALQGETEQPAFIPETFASQTASPSAFGSFGKTGETSAHAPQVNQAPDTRSRKSFLLPILLLVLLVVGIGASYLGFTLFRAMQGNTSTPGNSHSTTPTPTVTVTTSLKPNTYPRLAPAYSGQIVELNANQPSTMTLTGIAQNQNNGQISGTYNALQMQETFNGFIDTSKHITFSVASAPHEEIYFTGDMKPNGKLDGQFWTIDQSGNPINGGIFGVWSVAP